MHLRNPDFLKWMFTQKKDTQMKRKQFLTTTATALAEACSSAAGHVPRWLPSCRQGHWSAAFHFFNTIDNDVEGTLRSIAGVGYQEIESAFSRKGGYYGMKPKAFASFSPGPGLNWKSHHVIGAPL